MEIDKIKENLKKLENSPLFALSLGSKELFHSNFLYWLINAGVLGTKEDGQEITGRKLFCDIIEELSGIDINPQENWVARREKMNFDLSLWTIKTEDNGDPIINDKGLEDEDKCLLVIENKMKSVPSVKQIVEYIQKFEEDKVPRFILLTLMKKFPDRDKIEKPTPEQLKEWEIKELNCKIVTYKDLVDKLKESIQDIKNWEPYYKALISDYIEFVDVLSNLNFKNSESEDNSMMFELDDKFNDLRILQLVQAIRVGELYNLLHIEFEKDKERYKDIKFNTGYGQNGGAFLEIFFAPGIGRDNETGKEQKKEDNKGYEEPSHRSIGVQIQANRYSHFICPLDFNKKGKKDISQKEKNDQDKKWVEEMFNGFFSDNNKKFPSLLNNEKQNENKENQGKGKELLKFYNNSSENKILLSFESKKDGYHPRFAYQYARIPDQADYKFIVNQIVKDINYIIDNYDSDKLEIPENKS